MDNFVTVPEHVVESAAEFISDDPNNSFVRVLGYGKAYKDAGMTPIYILDTENADIHVVAQETFGKRLH